MTGPVRRRRMAEPRLARPSNRATSMRITRAVLFAVLGSLAAVAAPAQEPGSLPPAAPPGRLVDLGGWRLHLYCTGEPSASRPTVILEAGIGDFSVEWSLVQP